MSEHNNISKSIINLFGLWGLNEAECMDLLGISLAHKALFLDYKMGELIIGSQDLEKREAHLLTIHGLLQTLFPENKELRYKWMSQPNRAFNDAPINFARSRGIQGLVEIQSYLEAACYA